MDNTENENIAQKVISTLLDSGIILAITTSVIYIVAFLYLKGFYNFYGLHDIEIDMSLFKVIKISMDIIRPLISWIVSFFFISLTMAKLTKNPNPGTVLSILWIYMLCMMFIRLSRYTTIKWEHNLYIGLYWFVTIVMALIQPLLLLLPEKITSKISNHFEKRSKEPLYGAYKIFIMVCSISFVLSFIPKYGFYEATTKKDYLYDFQNNRVLIYQDDEKTIFLPKLEDESFEKKYIFVNTSDLSDVVFKHYEKEVVFKTNENDLIINSENIDKQSENENDIVEEVFK